jgi:HlyD family secretion protein
MQLSASIDESDLGQIAEGQPVRFTVDAYPADTFAGVVRQVRLNPVVASNVVTYAAIITAPNPELKLKPGMTASLTIEVARRDDVLRAPAAALRFRPSSDVLAALGVPAPGGRVPTVWQQTGETVAPVPVRTGITDGQWTELLEAPFAEGTPLVTRIVLDAGSQAAPAGAPSTSPLMGAQPRRR